MVPRRPFLDWLTVIVGYRSKVRLSVAQRYHVPAAAETAGEEKKPGPSEVPALVVSNALHVGMDMPSVGFAAVAEKALITGGAGFIGSHLAEYLLDRGSEVFVIDDLSTGAHRNVESLREREGFHLIVDSMLSPSVIGELVYKCDVVYHLAAAVGVRLIVERPVHTMRS